MALYEAFLDTLLPGNYALTKSMELTKRTSSGTLWYMKKFLTLYYFVFLTDDLFTTAYPTKASEIFDRYIDSLPAPVQAEAERYFYPEDGAVNVKSPEFNLFSHFAGETEFPTLDARQRYLQDARKYYFALLMGSGGQSGLKQRLKEAIRQPGFVYSHRAVCDILEREAAVLCARQANAREITDRSLPYILSREAMERACALAAARPVTEADVLWLMEAFPHGNPGYRAVAGDMIAFLRNERQILYYCGYVHARTPGGNWEFSSLTPIGELALQANAPEFLAVWEHQKLKLVSQPVAAEVHNIPEAVRPENFAVNFTPYTDILGHLQRHGSLSKKAYQYILSRKKHIFSQEEWEREDTTLLRHIAPIQGRVDSFRRQRDTKPEDSHKELLKYLLGIRGDLPLDGGTHPLGLVSVEGDGTCTVTDGAGLARLYRVYARLESYKLRRYGELFQAGEDDLRRRYAAAAAGETLTPDPRLKIRWDLYHIHPDTCMLLAIALTVTVHTGDIPHTAGGGDDINGLSERLRQQYPTLLRGLGLSADGALRQEVQRTVTALRTGDFTPYLVQEQAQEIAQAARYRAADAGALWRRIEALSRSCAVEWGGNRQRSGALPGLLKAYYLRTVGADALLRCECCGQVAFLTEGGEPYLEFHHLIPFAMACGPDHYLNLLALCPGCHRKLHYLPAGRKEPLYRDIDRLNYLELDIPRRLRELRQQRLLRSYHLEYLLADNAITPQEYTDIVS